jgi:L,D-transpeptidase ErfK/SrfK
LSWSPGSVSADVFFHDGNTSVYGRNETYRTKEGESLIEVARNFNIGFNAIAQANPELDPFVPGEGVVVAIPMQWILPDVQPVGIVINLSDYRLYHFFKEGSDNLVATYPIGIGDDGWVTPLGKFTVVEKLEKPKWTVPPSIRKEDPSLPAVVPPGPENPLGSHALRLSLRSVLIHGTNRPFGIGRKVSHGCIHLYPEDIPILFKTTAKGTRVTVVRQPVKIGKKEERIYVEIHQDNDFKGDYLKEAWILLKKKQLDGLVSMERLEAAASAKNGVVVDITLD